VKMKLRSASLTGPDHVGSEWAQEGDTLNVWFEKLIEASALASDRASLAMAIGRLAKELGFDRYAYINLQATASFAVSDYPQEWQQRYFAKSYSAIDPVVTTAKRCWSIFSWTNSIAERRPRKELRTFAEEASDFGIRSGISIPIVTGFRHMAMLTFATGASSVRADDINPAVAAATVAQLHARFTSHRSNPTSQKEVRLKPEELLCLRWSAEGKSMKMISQIEDIAFGNVRFYIENSKTALGAVSLPQATATAKVLGLI
jgi:LuxR family transcriptional activator of conjugal transfer of Ti plasmids